MIFRGQLYSYSLLKFRLNDLANEAWRIHMNFFQGFLAKMPYGQIRYPQTPRSHLITSIDANP